MEWRATLPFNKIEPGMVGDRFEPAAETAAGVVFEIAELARQFQQDILSHVFRIGVLQIPLPAPAINVPAVVLDEFIPSSVVQRVTPQAAQQGLARCRE